MPFDQWGITPQTAETITGTVVGDGDLDAALEDLVDYLGWRPNADVYGDPDPAATGHDVRARAFGRAVAWQAAYRTDVDRDAQDGAADNLTGESIGGGDYSYTREPGGTDAPTVCARSRTLLARGGFTAHGRTSITSP